MSMGWIILPRSNAVRAPRAIRDVGQVVMSNFFWRCSLGSGRQGGVLNPSSSSVSTYSSSRNPWPPGKPAASTGMGQSSTEAKPPSTPTSETPRGYIGLTAQRNGWSSFKAPAGQNPGRASDYRRLMSMHRSHAFSGSRHRLVP